MLNDADMPALYQAANASSMSARDTFFLLTKLRLGGLLLAAAGSSLSSPAGGIVSLVGFVTALLVEVSLLRHRPERTWWEGRAVAESAKTLAWRFAVCGEPFPIVTPLQEAEDELIRQLREARSGLEHAGVVPEKAVITQVSDGMRQLRSRPLEERKDIYRSGRIVDQCEWYTSKARWNHQRSERWSYGLVCLEVIGAVAAILHGTGTVRIDLMGITAAAVAAGATWLQAKQHATLAKAYAVAAQELAEASTQIDWQKTEDEWARFVDDAEQAISREHTRWNAQRGVAIGVKA